MKKILKYVKIVIPDVLSVKMKLILTVKDVMLHSISSEPPVLLVKNVKTTEDSTVMMTLMNVYHVITNVSIVPPEETIVMNVSHQESMLHNVSVQMDSSITETLV